MAASGDPTEIARCPSRSPPVVKPTREPIFRLCRYLPLGWVCRVAQSSSARHCRTRERQWVGPARASSAPIRPADCCASGRRKIEIQTIPAGKKRSATFRKRKTGLVKKAIELATLTDCDIGTTLPTSRTGVQRKR